MRMSDWSSDVCSSDLLVGHAFGITILGRLPCHAFECLLGGDTLDAGFFGILIFEFVEREAAAIGDVEGARERRGIALVRSEEHTSELQSLMRISYAVFCLKKKTHKNTEQIVKERQD